MQFDNYSADFKAKNSNKYIVLMRDAVPLGLNFRTYSDALSAIKWQLSDRYTFRPSDYKIQHVSDITPDTWENGGFVPEAFEKFRKSAEEEKNNAING